jgi:cytochrome c553
MGRRVIAAVLLAVFGAGSCGAEDEDALKRYGRHLASECASCHRSDAPDGAIPSLAGRPQAEIVALLEDFRSGRKTNPIMVSVAKSLDERQTAALAAYFASLPRHGDSAPAR